MRGWYHPAGPQDVPVGVESVLPLVSRVMSELEREASMRGHM